MVVRLHNPVVLGPTTIQVTWTVRAAQKKKKTPQARFDARPLVAFYSFHTFIHQDQTNPGDEGGSSGLLFVFYVQEFSPGFS